MNLYFNTKAHIKSSNLFRIVPKSLSRLPIAFLSTLCVWFPYRSEVTSTRTIFVQPYWFHLPYATLMLSYFPKRPVMSGKLILLIYCTRVTFNDCYIIELLAKGCCLDVPTWSSSSWCCKKQHTKAELLKDQLLCIGLIAAVINIVTSGTNDAANSDDGVKCENAVSDNGVEMNFS